MVTNVEKGMTVFTMKKRFLSGFNNTSVRNPCILDEDIVRTNQTSPFNLLCCLDINCPLNLFEHLSFCSYHFPLVK